MKKNTEKKIWSIVDMSIWILLAFFSILQVIPIIEGVSSESLRNFYWFLIYLGGLLIISYSSYKVYNAFSKNNWIQCENFPNNDRICLKVRNILSDDSFIQNKPKKSFDRIEKDDDMLYQEFLNVTLQFFLLSRKNCYMTLPYDPYEQIVNNKKKTTLNNSLDAINGTLIKQKNKTKIITLSLSELNKFKSNFFNDFSSNGIENLGLKEYLNKHKKINIFWCVNPSIAIEEFITIDESVDISVSETKKCVQVDFHKATIDSHNSKFETISTVKKTSLEFFNEYLLSDKNYFAKFNLSKEQEKKIKNIFC